MGADLTPNIQVFDWQMAYAAAGRMSLAASAQTPDTRSLRVLTVLASNINQWRFLL